MGEYEDSYALTCERYHARVADLFGGPVAPITPTNPDANYIANGNFKYIHTYEWDPSGTVIPTAGKLFPSMHRLCPGGGAQMHAVIELDAAPAESGQGNALYYRWTQGQWDPTLECGSQFHEMATYAFDSLVHPLTPTTVEFSYWMRVDACCIAVGPCVMVNYHDNDYEFIYPVNHMVTEAWVQYKTYIVLPPSAGHVLSNSRYLLFGLSSVYPFAPGIHIAGVRLVK